ncbi:hypothetical protein [Novosphingobium arvoryzae]|uniref:DUF3618 domain-containing protein n=1 Tax=Novosphingobium arvoryzae TaxID=1256514 RepID=A0A918RFP1_9SPHN|nr:hypothetical protein [Novosphingobium arvoryzae]GGZ95020.1 hypothetical protein GCM10011617_13700 [Novosphingobium arvoryzae]
MTEAEERLAADRANRNAARQLVDGHVAQIKADLAARSVGGRVVDKVTGDALDLADQALTVAKNSKGIIAGAIGALALWTFRDQVSRTIGALLRPAAVQDDAASTATSPSTEEPSE